MRIMNQKYMQQKSHNTYEDFVSDLTEGIMLDPNAQIPKTLDNETITKFLSSPDEYIDKLTELMVFEYLTRGEIYQQYSLFKVLPKLNYRIKSFDSSLQGYEEHVNRIDMVLSQVKYKTTTRDMISQICASGNLACCILGNKSNPYIYIFNSDEFVFSGYKRNGEWVVLLDMAKYKDMKEAELTRAFETFQSIGLKQYYNKFLRDEKKFKYMELPVERTHLIRANTLFSNQLKGVPYGIQSLYDFAHKDELRRLESNLVSRVVKGIAVLKMGNKDFPYTDISQGLINKVQKSVKAALVNASKSSTQNIPVAMLPGDISELVFPDTGKTLDIFSSNSSDKFADANSSISMATGVGSVLSTGEGSNYMAGKLNLSMIYSRIDELLELIAPIYNKLIGICLTKKIASNYSFEFCESEAIPREKVLDTLMQLGNQGYTIKPILEIIGMDYLQYLDSSYKEIEEFKLRDRILPPHSAHTTSHSIKGSDCGRPTNENPDNPNTASSQETGASHVDGSIK